jgi:hypothetical protein
MMTTLTPFALTPSATRVQTPRPQANFGEIYIHLPSAYLNPRDAQKLLMEVKHRLSASRDTYFPKHDYFHKEDLTGGTHLFVGKNELTTENEGTIYRALAGVSASYKNATVEQMTTEKLNTKYQEVTNPAPAQVQQPEKLRDDQKRTRFFGLGPSRHR